jgi:hypothetical protein
MIRKYTIAFVFAILCIGLTACGGGGGDGGDGITIDSDGDGIPNDLEVNGYTYDYETGIYSLWNGDVSVEYFKSDPMQPSTDGDPYSDSMEVSGLLMDRSVAAPGDHPMIPAAPNLIVKMIAYDVALNADITETDGTVHEEGENWNTDTWDTTSITDEWHWDVSEEVSCSLTDFGASVNVSYGESQAVTHTTGTVKSNGGNIMHSTQWSMATCSNPSKAAKIKLTLQAKNVGTCVAKDITLTMNLIIGGKIVSTIEEVEIPTLEMDKDYTWVVGSSTDILLTYGELRLLETGASVAIEVTNLSANVVKKVGDVWETVGTWDNYMRDARAVCAHLFLDLGDGNTTEHLIYADDSESAPEVTLKDAIIWAANAHDDPALGPVVSFYQTDGSLGSVEPLNDWYFSLDATTYDSISDYIKNPDFNLFDTVLGPNTIVVAKAPPIEDWPKIRWATMSPREGIVTAYVDDYFFNQNLLEVYFVDKNDVEHSMTWNEDKFYFFCTCPDNYIKDGTEKIVACNALYDPDKPDTWKWQTEMPASQMGYVPGFKNGYIVGSYDTPGAARDVFVKDNYAYVADWSSGLQVIDVSDPANPYQISEWDTPSWAREVFVIEQGALTLAYLADYKEQAPLSESGLLVIDVTDPGTPDQIGKWSSPGLGTGVFVKGDYAYMTDHSFGFHVLNISDPYHPKKLATCCDFEAYYSVFVSGDYAYVADGGFGLQVIDVSDPTSPEKGDVCPTSDFAYAVFVSGNYAYVADGNAGLQVIDISDPTDPGYEGSYDTLGSAQGVFVSGNYAYVADWNAGLQVIGFK